MVLQFIFKHDQSLGLNGEDTECMIICCNELYHQYGVFTEPALSGSTVHLYYLLPTTDGLLITFPEMALLNFLIQAHPLLPFSEQSFYFHEKIRSPELSFFKVFCLHHTSFSHQSSKVNVTTFSLT